MYPPQKRIATSIPQILCLIRIDKYNLLLPAINRYIYTLCKYSVQQYSNIQCEIPKIIIFHNIALAQIRWLAAAAWWSVFARLILKIIIIITMRSWSNKDYPDSRQSHAMILERENVCVYLKYSVYVTKSMRGTIHYILPPHRKQSSKRNHINKLVAVTFTLARATFKNSKNYNQSIM